MPRPDASGVRLSTGRNPVGRLRSFTPVPPAGDIFVRNPIPVLFLSLTLAACTAPTQPDSTATPAVAAPVQETGMAKPSALQAALVLSGHHWRLADARDGEGKRIDALFVRADKPLQLDFNASMLSVVNGCNSMSGHHVLTGDSLTVNPMASTMMACSDRTLMALDQEIGKRLQGKLAMRIDEGDAPTLVLTNAAGDVLTFTGEMTAETRYGGPGERVFLEVAAATRPCSHPLIPDKQCLQVREVKYDDKGLKIGEPGEFRNFYDDIEGYEHRDGMRNVLRVDRYTRKDVPADASKYAYVLDMVVESDASKR